MELKIIVRNSMYTPVPLENAFLRFYLDTPRSYMCEHLQ